MGVTAMVKWADPNTTRTTKRRTRAMFAWADKLFFDSIHSAWETTEDYIRYGHKQRAGAAIWYLAKAVA